MDLTKIIFEGDQKIPSYVIPPISEIPGILSPLNPSKHIGQDSLNIHTLEFTLHLGEELNLCGLEEMIQLSKKWKIHLHCKETIKI